MSSFIEKLAHQRQKFLDGLDANEGDINLDIFEDFYPDQAHFVFELLQNAEDAGATEARFTLLQNGCRFEHNGTRDFTEADVRSITGIHNSTKDKAPDQIGKFGVGFKSVFVYTIAPIIQSGEFAFRISRLVLPEPIEQDTNACGKTSFWLPFDNPKKTPEAAYAEVEAGLRELAETTLLFLTHLEAIYWQTGQGISGDVLRIKHSDCHFEVLKQSGGQTTTSSHFLKFDRPVEGLEKQRVAVAFALDFLPVVQQFDTGKKLARQLRVIPASPGKVAVFFPAEKEASGLRFHLHAPFVPELSRASIKETSANQPLFQQLASLAAASLHPIRDLGLLTADFLAVLPNPHDALPNRYKCIKTSIVEEMNSHPLTPTYDKSHAPARHLLQAGASLKDLLSEEDIEFLVERDKGTLKWAIGAAQKNSEADRFLLGLAITKWDVEEFLEQLSEKTSEGSRYISVSRSSEGSHYISVSRYVVKGPDEGFMNWLSSKPLEWHQKLYAVLHSELSPTGGYHRLNDRRIIRLSNGEYGVGNRSFFPSDNVEHDDVLPRVDAGVYSSGKSKLQQENARKFLEEVGVRVVGEAEQVEAILKQRYKHDNFKPKLQELNRFIALVENEPKTAKLFADYCIFKGKDGKWHQPANIFLDQPFTDTGLSAYYDALGTEAKKSALADSYHCCGISVEIIAKFAEAIGAKSRLEPSKVFCYNNPQWSYLESVGGERFTSNIDDDYVIVGLESLLAAPSLAISKLVWRTMQLLQPRFLKATFQKSVRWGPRFAESQLVHHLRNAAWIPQGNASFVRPAEAASGLLPEGFSFDSGWPWLEAIQFGQAADNRFEAQLQKHFEAEALGFSDAASMERAKRFAALPADQQERILSEMERSRDIELPEHEPANPERRAQRVAREALDAPQRQTEKRTRSVSVGRDAVKENAAEYLRQQYTTDGGMICQVCMGPMPFKLDDGSDYFEKVEFLPDLTNRHYQNYLALCPNHAAMYEHANGSSKSMMEMLVALTGNELQIVLAQRATAVYFTKTHIADLKTLIKSDCDEARESTRGFGRL
jgi:hypothetical protein